MTSRQQLGRDGEAAVAAYMQRLGWSIVGRNWRPTGAPVRGEIDIIARDAHTMVFCEVKTRSGSGAGNPLEAVTRVKAQRLRVLAAAWLAEHDMRWLPIRFDVVGVHWPPSALVPTLEHVRDVVV